MLGAYWYVQPFHVLLLLAFCKTCEYRSQEVKQRDIFKWQENCISVIECTSFLMAFKRHPKNLSFLDIPRLPTPTPIHGRHRARFDGLHSLSYSWLLLQL